jgi:hypothetical protein
LKKLIDKIVTKPRISDKPPNSAEGSPKTKEIDPIKRYPWRDNMGDPMKAKKDSLPQIVSARPSYKNYLSELPHKTTKNESAEIMKIKEIMKDGGMKKLEKYERAKVQLSMIEEKAKWKEDLMKANKTTANENFEDATNLVLDSINAKIKLLNHFNQS